jgi:hypothetical protein
MPDADRLIQMGDVEFRELVVEESKGNAPWATEIFTTDLEVCERWVESLQWFSQEAMGQLQDLRLWNETMMLDPEVERKGQAAEYRRRKGRASWFRGKIEERLREAKLYRSELRRDVSSETQTSENAVMVWLLRKVDDAGFDWDAIEMYPDTRALLERVTS